MNKQAQKRFGLFLRVKRGKESLRQWSKEIGIAPSTLKKAELMAPISEEIFKRVCTKLSVDPDIFSASTTSEDPWMGMDKTFKNFAPVAEPLLNPVRAKKSPHGDAVTERGKNPHRHQLEGGLETIDIIFAMGDGEAFCRGNIIKYVIRSRYDETGTDIKKAKHYSEILLESQERADADRQSMERT